MKFFGILLLVTCSALAAEEPLRNIGYLASGYDIFYGNPRSTEAGTDPGFRHAIFHFTFTQNLTTDDKTYLIPDNTTFRKNVGCTLDFNSDSIQGTKSYMNSLEEDVSTGAGYAGASFSASTDFKTVQDSSSANDNRFTSSQSVCIAYDGYLDHYQLPAFSDNFQAGVKSLPAEYNEDDYMDFLEEFGTHYVEHSKMGAKYGVRTEFTESSWKKMLSQRIKVEAAAGYDGLFSVSASSLTDSEKEQAETFSQLSENKKTFTIGSKPPADGDQVTWANQALEEPMPIKYDLKVLSALFTAELVGDLREDYAQLKENVAKAIFDYCQTLFKRGLVQTCETLPDDPDAPAVVNSCRFCAQKCGGNFPVDGGAVDIGYFASMYEATTQLYPEGCEGNIGSYDQSGNGARFCCEPSDSNHLGRGRICNTCGGSYSEFGGKLMGGIDSPTHVSVYDNECTGDARQRHNLNIGFSICFTETPLCQLCATCGGDYRQETTAVEGSVLNFFMMRGDSCSGDFSYPVFPATAQSLCCKSIGPMQQNMVVRDEL